ncbi:FKBP-type peptidyl-prolyl cis-trans isomerase [uncultured Lamprocystis sp.]|jgi:FKBP-type peptidyl-prolyl cis-trans isomerase FklB|uniref:FKBP-type peptidyl-prolyl cis-trans isomerase n=1 Tax=uncultured Lamprocystis sp. TaxID=543132 RepID=UPI0025D18B25|nr:FKBP-type peptidyl-prolyl cis-trans isomerase [uncultured Lamprocystis sp.]
MRIRPLIGVALLAIPYGILSAADPLNLADETARINYSLGYQIGGDFKRQGVEMNTAAIVKGIEDAISGAEPLIPTQDMRTTLMELKRKIVAEQKAKAAEQEQKMIEAGKKFMEENAKQPGVVTTASGLQYQIVEAGKGKTPSPTDQVSVNYRGTLVDGKEFDSSYSRGEPTSFQLNEVVEGWTEGLQLIKEGGKIKLFVPPTLAYGNSGPMANQTLIFDVELLSVGEAPTPEETPEAAEPEKGK